MFISKLRFYSMGLVATDKADDTHDIQVIPIEVIPTVTGAVGDVESKVEVSGKDSEDVGYTVELNFSNTITATWMPMGSNRLTSPNLVKDEQVLIWQFGDTDRYYWSPLGRDDDLRLLETIVFGIAARASEDDELDPANNMYTLEVSSHGQHITLRTTKDLGEPFAYTFQLNTGEGQVTLSDDNDNLIELSSETGRIKAINKEDTEITIEEEEIFAKAKGDITAESDTKITMRSPKQQFGMDDDVQPSVLGDNHAAGHEDLENQINASKVIGNLGIPTSPIAAVKPVEVSNLKKGGESYSTVNTNQ